MEYVMEKLQNPSSREKERKLLQTKHNIFITGTLSNGMEELLHNFYEEETHMGKKIVFAGTKGITASKLPGSRTLHALLKRRTGEQEYDYNDCMQELQEADIVIVLEVEGLDWKVLRHLYMWWLGKKKKPRIILCGDFRRLLVTNGGKASYLFASDAWMRLKLKPIILDDIVEQKDVEFFDMLRLAGIGDKRCLAYFNCRVQKELARDSIALCARKEKVALLNSRRINQLPGMQKEYPAKGELVDIDFSKLKIDKVLIVKPNMRVVALKNDSERRYYNGSLGTVLRMEENEITVRFDNGNVVNMTRDTYNIKCKHHYRKKVSIQQFSLKAGYAITIHQSQGQVFDKVSIYATGCWCAGQLYEALSRTNTIEGIYLEEPLEAEQLIVDERVVDYYNSLEEEFYEMMEED